MSFHLFLLYLYGGACYVLCYMLLYYMLYCVICAKKKKLFDPFKLICLRVIKWEELED